MASVVGIWNLALSHIGQNANVSSPNEQSMEAEYCNQFYPIALNVMLEDFPWTFASKRANLALLSTTIEPWRYGYALPSDCLKSRKVLPQEPCHEEEFFQFMVENGVVCTNVENAQMVYTYNLTDTTKFTTEFTHALTRLLASYIAGPIIKDPTGRIANLQYQAYLSEMGRAQATNGNSDRVRPHYVPSSIRARMTNVSPTYCPIGDNIDYPSGFEIL